MKLRLLDDSIRLRLSRSDVQAAEAEGIVEAQTRFPDGATFRFALEALAQGPASASCVGNRMVVRLPAEEISRWAENDEAVSLRGVVELPDGSQLSLLVEKDFQCLTARPEEDQTDLFVNPQADDC